MTDHRNLSRSRDGRVIHRSSCRHARAPWPYADTLSDDELLNAKLYNGYRICRVCEPDFRRPAESLPAAIAVWRDYE